MKYEQKEVLSDFNFSAFLQWCSKCSIADLEEAIRECPVTDHFSPFQTLPMIVNRENQQYAISSIQCNDATCSRCREGRGGYQFKWIGPWTDEAFIPRPGETGPDARRRIILNARRGG